MQVLLISRGRPKHPLAGLSVACWHAPVPCLPYDVPALPYVPPTGHCLHFAKSCMYKFVSVGAGSRRCYQLDERN